MSLQSNFQYLIEAFKRQLNTKSNKSEVYTKEEIQAIENQIDIQKADRSDIVDEVGLGYVDDKGKDVHNKLYGQKTLTKKYLWQLPVGAKILLEETDPDTNQKSLVNYIILKQDRSTDTPIVIIARETVPGRGPSGTSETKEYDGSLSDQYCTNFINRFSETIQGSLIATDIMVPVYDSVSGETSWGKISRKAYLRSHYESLQSFWQEALARGLYTDEANAMLMLMRKTHEDGVLKRDIETKNGDTWVSYTMPDGAESETVHIDTEAGYWPWFNLSGNLEVTGLNESGKPQELNLWDEDYEYELQAKAGKDWKTAYTEEEPSYEVCDAFPRDPKEERIYFIKNENGDYDAYQYSEDFIDDNLIENDTVLSYHFVYSDEHEHGLAIKSEDQGQVAKSEDRINKLIRLYFPPGYKGADSDGGKDYLQLARALLTSSYVQFNRSQFVLNFKNSIEASASEKTIYNKNYVTYSGSGQIHTDNPNYQDALAVFNGMVKDRDYIPTTSEYKRFALTLEEPAAYLRILEETNDGIACELAYRSDYGWKKISNKVDEPTLEGTDGQVLSTDGAGGRTWISVDKAEVKNDTDLVIAEGTAQSLNNVNIGTSVYLYENNENWFEYIVVEKRDSAVICLRKNTIQSLGYIGENQDYNGISIDTYLTTTFYNRFTSDIKDSMVSVPIRYRQWIVGTGTGNIIEINRKIYAPSPYELYSDETQTVTDGYNCWALTIPNIAVSDNAYWLRRKPGWWNFTSGNADGTYNNNKDVRSYAYTRPTVALSPYCSVDENSHILPATIVYTNTIDKLQDGNNYYKFADQDVRELVPSNASSSNKLATASDITSAITGVLSQSFPISNGGGS